MLREISRSDFGMPDGAEGFVYLLDDEPILQIEIHGASRVNTVFWRGRTTLPELSRAFEFLVLEAASFFTQPADQLRSITTAYATTSLLHKSHYYRQPADEIERDVTLRHDSLLRSISPELIFARLDLEEETARNNEKIILDLWADFLPHRFGSEASDEEPEIGLAAQFLSDYLLEFFRRTSVRRVSDRDRDQIAERLINHFALQPA